MFTTLRIQIGKILNIPHLYEKTAIGCTTIGLVSGSLYGAGDTRIYNHVSLQNTMFDVITNGLLGTGCGMVIGLLSPILVPVCLVSGVISLGTYGYNQINPVIPWYQKNNGNKNNYNDDIKDIKDIITDLECL
jgi:hypothetical protein